jgi:phenylacetate-coenzyme A ligase PaaK-like adenylate-forming protein
VFVYDEAAWIGFVLSLTRPLVARLRGAGVPPGFPIALVAAYSAVHATGSAAAWSAGGDMPLRLILVPVTLPLDEIVKRLNGLSLPGLVGYPTMLARLALEQQSGRLRIHPQFVGSTSETLTPSLRATITEAFGGPITNSFASREGLIGLSATVDDTVVINSDFCIAEVVDAQKRPVPPGVPGNNVLLTNLFNLVQPLIRYEVGDHLVEAASAGFLKATVEGRSDEMLTFGYQPLHPLVISGVLVKHPEVVDYQVQQTARGIHVAALSAAKLNSAELAGQLRDAVAEAGLPHLQVTIGAVESLPRQPDSGKLRRFIPLV